jgi:hypothetical protein
VRKIAEKMDATLKELMTGTLLFGLVCLAAGVWFVDSPLKYILGLLIGLILALSAAWHMHYSICRNMDLNAGNDGAANAYAVKNSMLRYGVILVVFLAVCLTDFAYPLAVFLGIMGLKAGAYLQPFTRKYLFKNEDTE